jgi:hypothetical protein
METYFEAVVQILAASALCYDMLASIVYVGVREVGKE